MDDPLRIKGKQQQMVAVETTWVNAVGSYDTGATDWKERVSLNLLTLLGDLPGGRGHLHIDISWRRADPPQPPDCPCEPCESDA